MITNQLFEKALIDPCKEGATDLKIISGYATSAMAFHHLEEIKAIDKNVNITLLVGMCPADGISIGNHKGFQNIMESAYANIFKCSYIYNKPQVHSKLYIWTKEDKLLKAFIGSANYTQNAFSKRQREILVEIKDEKVLNYYQQLENDSIYCNHQDADSLIKIYNDKNYFRRQKLEEITVEIDDPIPNKNELEKITVSLLSKNGEIQNKGGLNWGQRDGRNPNQAYIQLPPEVYKTDYFPKKPNQFTIYTDDDKILICTRAQKDEEGHAIETPHNNSLIGEYFRNRLGLANGAFVTKQDLQRYGRTDVTFYKEDDENNYLDFSVE
jgi:hypothetical protein